MIYSTRNQDGVIHEHTTVEDAIQYFLAEDGYRLDLYTKDGKSLFVYRGDLEEQQPDSNYYKADSKIVAMIPNSNFTDNNVVHVNFTKPDPQQDNQEIDYFTQMEHFIGKRVELISVDDEHTHLKPGAQGTIDYIDSVGTIFVEWDDGSNLGLIPGVDQWKNLY